MKVRPSQYKALLWLLPLLLLLSACEKEEPDCFEPNIVLMRMAFLSKDSVHVDTLIDSILIDTTIIRYRDTFFKSPTLTSTGMPQNIILYGSPYNNYISAPLNPDAYRLQYILGYDTTSAATDTLTCFYHASVHFISNSCGFTHFFHIDSIQSTRHVIDSVALINRSVTDNASDRHLNLYFFNH